MRGVFRDVLHYAPAVTPPPLHPIGVRASSDEAEAETANGPTPRPRRAERRADTGAGAEGQRDGTASGARGRWDRLSELGAEGMGRACGGLREYYSIDEGICQGGMSYAKKIPRRGGRRIPEYAAGVGARRLLGLPLGGLCPVQPFVDHLVILLFVAATNV